VHPWRLPTGWEEVPLTRRTRKALEKTCLDLSLQELAANQSTLNDMLAMLSIFTSGELPLISEFFFNSVTSPFANLAAILGLWRLQRQNKNRMAEGHIPSDKQATRLLYPLDYPLTATTVRWVYKAGAVTTYAGLPHDTLSAGVAAVKKHVFRTKKGRLMLSKTHFGDTIARVACLLSLLGLGLLKVENEPIALEKPPAVTHTVPAPAEPPKVRKRPPNATA